MHVQSCYFANLNLLVYCRSRWRRRRPCFPYFIHGTYVSLCTKSYLFISVFTDLFKLSSEVIYIFIYLHVFMKEKSALDLSVDVIKHDSTIWGHYFYVSSWRRDRLFTWSSEPREGLATCRTKTVPSFLS